MLIQETRFSFACGVIALHNLLNFPGGCAVVWDKYKRLDSRILRSLKLISK